MAQITVWFTVALTSRYGVLAKRANISSKGEEIKAFMQVRLLNDTIRWVTGHITWPPLKYELQLEDFSIFWAVRLR